VRVEAIQACIDYAKQKDSTYGVLYASRVGELLYHKMGFKITEALREYFFDPL
jgi:hypothetical protein